MALSSGAVRSRSENSMFVLMVILLGSPAVWCFVGRLEGATIIGTDQWRNG